MKTLSYLKNVCLTLLLATLSVFSQNYEIGITINTNTDTLILAHYFTKRDRMLMNDSVILVNGSGVFSGDRELPKGVYFIATRDGRWLFDIMMGDNQQFNIIADTADILLNKFTSSPDNDVFYEFQRYNTERGRLFQQMNEQFRNATSDEERLNLRNDLQAIMNDRIKYIEDLIEANSHLYVSKWLRTLIPVETYVPDPPRDAEGNITDPSYQYWWYRRHFFDNLNIFDPDMLRTEQYEDKMFEFLTRVIPQQTDTINAELDKMFARARDNDAIFRYLLVTIFNHFYGSQDIVRGLVVPENVWVHIAENWYIPYAHWSTEEFTENLKSEVAKRKPNLIGNKAPPMEMLMVLPPEHFRAAAMDTAIKYDYHAGRMVDDFRRDNEFRNSKFTVLYFWDFTCGHCRTGIQSLFNVWEENNNKGLQVITVQLVLTQRQDKGRWIDFVNENNLFGQGWFNAWSPYDHKFRDYYNTSVVPVMYLLDENFDIILRNIVAEHVKDFFDNQVQ